MIARKSILCCLLGLWILLAWPAIILAGDYIIGEGDTLFISVWGVDKLNFSVKVRPDGKITVPGLGEVAASGVIPLDLQAELTNKLKTLVKNPIVTVTVTDITNCKAYVFGGGIKSGVFDLNKRSSLLQVLCQIGDVRGADLKRAYVLRNGKKIKEGLKKLFIEGDITEDIFIETGDVIFIPVLQDKSIFVLGEVNTPKAVEWREGITVMEVILESGGFTKFASQNDTIVVRKEDGKETKLRVKAKDLLKSADLNQNIRLKPGDYVIVSESIF